MKITREEVQRVADLAYLELNETELESFARHLDSILTYSDKLNELNTDGVEPMTQVVPAGAHTAEMAGSTPLREDTPVACDILMDVLAGAPDADSPYFRVPKVIER
jgi:aspartyl-tRNA(Asn)/glutamyl-tRNA(Gln) amidotransferase subunit C